MLNERKRALLSFRRGFAAGADLKRARHDQHSAEWLAGFESARQALVYAEQRYKCAAAADKARPSMGMVAALARPRLHARQEHDGDGPCAACEPEELPDV